MFIVVKVVGVFIYTVFDSQENEGARQAGQASNPIRSVDIIKQCFIL